MVDKKWQKYDSQLSWTIHSSLVSTQFWALMLTFILLSFHFSNTSQNNCSYISCGQNEHFPLSNVYKQTPSANSPEIYTSFAMVIYGWLNVNEMMEKDPLKIWASEIVREIVKESTREKKIKIERKWERLCDIEWRGEHDRKKIETVKDTLCTSWGWVYSNDNEVHNLHEST